MPGQNEELSSDNKGLSIQRYYKGFKYPVVGVGSVYSYGEKLGEYFTYLKQGIPHTFIRFRFKKTLDVVGDYTNCKYDSLSGIIFIEVRFNYRSGVVALDIRHSEQPIIYNYNKLFDLVNKYNIPLSLSIEQNLIIAVYGEKQALIEQILLTPDSITVIGYKDERIEIKGFATKDTEAVCSESSSRESKDDSNSEIDDAEQEELQERNRSSDADFTSIFK